MTLAQNNKYIIETLKAPAKINLCLDVGNRRNDGYHNVNMIMQKVSLYDDIAVLIIKDATTDTECKEGVRHFESLSKESIDVNSNDAITIFCNQATIPTDESNLIYKIVSFIYEKYGIRDRIYIYLNKTIPASAGLGGGSSDAATMLLFLDKHYNLNLSIKELIDIASMFGSDIPFFVYKSVAICKGRGEIVEELKPFCEYYVVIANPCIKVSTREVYEQYDNYLEDCKFTSDWQTDSLSVAANGILCHDLRMLCSGMFNNLEKVTESLYEEIAMLKMRLMHLGALKALMSGSGPTVFGIFNTYDEAKNCEMSLKNEKPEYFVYLARPI